MVRTSNKPILFVEGPSDVEILNIAFRKLYGEVDMPFLVQDAFDAGFLKILFKNGKIFEKYPNKTLFALFDFDSTGYKEWRDIDNEDQYICEDIRKGLCKKVKDKNGYAILLPVPDIFYGDMVNESSPLEKIRPNPFIGIEHLFYSYDDVKKLFRGEEKPKFNNNKKISFAIETAKEIPNQYFEIFRPIFELIRRHIV